MTLPGLTLLTSVKSVNCWVSKGRSEKDLMALKPIEDLTNHVAKY